MLRISNIGSTRLAGASAIGFAMIVFLVNALILTPAGLPPTGAPAGDVVDFLAAATPAVALATVFLPTAWVLSVVFAAGVVTASQKGARAWALVGFAGIVSQNLTIMIVSAVRVALEHAAPAEPLVALAWAFHDAAFVLNGTFLATALLGLSLAGVQSGLIPRWLAGAGLVAGACQFASATLTPWVVDEGPLGLLGLAGWLVWIAWLVAYGILLLRAGTPARAQRAARSAGDSHVPR